MGGGDQILGEGGNDLLIGGDGRDTIRGGLGNDILRGDTGNDLLAGGHGDDRISGGAGADRMFGGEGADRFVFGTISDLGRGNNADVIADFESGVDRIALQALETNLTYIGKAAFSGTAGEVRFAPTRNVLAFDFDGDGAADAVIHLPDVTVLLAEDLIL
ncbi:M10 family metallopeptidase C-terminal domain-containing protein [Ruixingdingia sedimenti]|uniref:M10 family metallopeptidase C-terminal domain-containing protein n=1 Tax=Ruixingdingia sedimenti TaxID=3073604 RepID=A0ABU1FFB1_9RHOB|nr:M10 family metallopeptidase C-terminal domain-containing protein [Xinfangfangia sp. LG-4]MDR5655164.1 M10 family metallopeptidase C-terminal domain-containing protein [Xinfangfangia sp. LG-4]